MILQALNRYYEILAADPESGIALRFYSTASVSFVLNVSADGVLLDIFPLVDTVQRGKKIVEVPRKMIVPEMAIRTVNISANFLCDNCEYVFGLTKNENNDQKKVLDRFKKFMELNVRLLKQVNCPEASAVIAFLTTYDPETAETNPIIARCKDDLVKGGNLVFKLDGENKFIHEKSEIKQVWEKYKMESVNQVFSQCLVTGEVEPIARLHPKIKGIKDAQSSGASLVSFNERAYESFNKKDGQGLNSPVSEKASFAYGTILNYLLSPINPNKKINIGDATIVYWAESPDKTYEAIFAGLFEPDWNLLNEPPSENESVRDKKAENLLRALAEKIKSGQGLDISQIMEGLNPDTRFYILGMAPNAARVSIRFFHKDAFKCFVSNIVQHYEDMRIIKEFPDQPDIISPRRIIDETVSKKARVKLASPLLAGSFLRSILNNTPYPAALFNAVLIRIRGDVDDSEKRISKINYTRAAIIKAYLKRKYRTQHNSQIQEVLGMSLNETSTNQAYLLGRLFAVLEKAQQDAAGGALNATIKDRYFTSACASPASVFPVLLRLSQHHISKVKTKSGSIYLDQLIGKIMGLLEIENDPIPVNFSLDQQGIFVLGYYHQRANFYTKKEDRINQKTEQPINFEGAENEQSN